MFGIKPQKRRVTPKVFFGALPKRFGFVGVFLLSYFKKYRDLL